MLSPKHLQTLTKELQSVSSRVQYQTGNWKLNCPQLNIYPERRRGYWPYEASGNLADVAKVPMPARYGSVRRERWGSQKSNKSLLEAPPPRGVSSLPHLQTGRLTLGRTPLALEKGVQQDIALTDLQE
jgi:hypothetical protein